ncbi:MAG: replication-associated recombination protein A [Clostridia bacterium]
MEPLAYKMKPTSLEEFVGQDEIVGNDKLLYKLIKEDKLSSVIFYGPPGSGKTSLARVIANTTKNNFNELNATTAGVADIKKIVEGTNNSFLNVSNKTIVFIDEIHRFNKLQQDSLLPYVESGKIILIGATTENPYYSVNKALISRSTVFKFNKLNDIDIYKIIKNTLSDTKKGLGNYLIKITDETIKYLANIVNGDVRTALNILEFAVSTINIDKDGYINITNEDINKCSINKNKYDKNGDSHYDIISAFIKSIRGSDENAALFYLAVMLDSGEDIMFIARRLVILASEDIGLANNNAAILASSILNSVNQIGMPESRILLSHLVIYLAKSKKSNSAYLGINKALEDTNKNFVVPSHINSTAIGYKYPHDYDDSFVVQQYLPDVVKDDVYYIKKRGDTYEN